MRYLKKEAKQCPKCDFFVEKNGGCHTMVIIQIVLFSNVVTSYIELCGTDSHGKVVEALKNGGCAYLAFLRRHQLSYSTGSFHQTSCDF